MPSAAENARRARARSTFNGRKRAPLTGIATSLSSKRTPVAQRGAVLRERLRQRGALAQAPRKLSAAEQRARDARRRRPAATATPTPRRRSANPLTEAGRRISGR